MTSQPAVWQGSLVLIAPADPFRPSLADALMASGGRVQVVDPIEDCTCGEGAVRDADDLRSAIEETAPEAIVHLVGSSGSISPVPFEQLDIPGWIRRVHDPLWSLVETLRIAETGSAAVIVVVDSTGLSGAPGSTMT